MSLGKGIVAPHIAPPMNFIIHRLLYSLVGSQNGSPMDTKGKLYLKVAVEIKCSLSQGSILRV